LGLSCTSLVIFDCSANQLTGSLPSFVTCQLTLGYFQDNQFTGSTTDLSGDVAEDIRFGNNLFTLNGTTTFCKTDTYLSSLRFEVSGNAIPTAEIDELFHNMNLYYTANIPPANLVVNADGGTNGGPTGGQSNTDIVALKALFISAGHVFTANINSTI
jgi:hypothetical protein